MMYRHKQYGIIWKMLNHDKTKCQLINNGKNFKPEDIGRIIEVDKGYSDKWDDGVSGWIPYGFSEYIKLLNK